MYGKQVCAITATLHLEEFLVVAYLSLMVYICHGEGYLSLTATLDLLCIKHVLGQT